jgi:TonB-dependent starch-binding outer membrane protein SusC
MRITSFGRIVVAALFAIAAFGTVEVAEARQGGTITGQVLEEETRRPLVGVAVTVSGTQLTAVTNDAGRFLFVNVPPGTREVRVQMLGFGGASQMTTVVAGETVTLDFTLRPSAIALEQVVVTGTAGRQERRAQAAVVAHVQAADIVDTSPVSTLSDVLMARTPGVSLNQASGTAGTGQRIRIRGAASISLSNEPLVFIDGVRMDSRLREFHYVGGQHQSRLNDINPDEIESIEIVKGPAAATLYGADASAGVIQIITKRGRAGQDRFTQSITGEFHSVERTWDPPANFGQCTQALINAGRELCVGRQPGDVVSDNPIMREGVFRTGAHRSLAWSGRGGGQNYGYFLSLGRDDEDGILPNNEYNRTAGRVNFDWNPAPQWRIEAGFGITRTETDLPINDNNIYGYLGGSLLGNPLNVGAASNGWYAPFRGPAAISSIENSSRVLRTIPTLQLNYNPVGWFSNRLTIGADVTRAEAWSFFPLNDSTWYAGDLNLGQIDEIRENSDRITFDYLGNIRSHFGAEGQYSSDLSFGAQVIGVRTDLIQAIGTGIPTNEARNVNAAAQRAGNGNFSESRSVGFLGQWQFGHLDRRFVQLGARVDQNSAFGREADAFFLPKVGFSWVISEEPFFEGLQSAVNTLRLRGAWGTTGRSPTPGASLETYNPAPFALTSTLQRSGVIPLNPGNVGLKPERGEEFEAGFDAEFLNGRVGAEVTYFNKTTRDLLLRRPLPPSQGFTQNPFVNIGEVVNRGWEFALNARIIDEPNFGWSARLAMNTLDNELVTLGDIEPFGTFNRFEAGLPLGTFVTRTVQRIGRSEGECPQPASPTAPRVTECAIVSDDLEPVANFLPTNEGSFSSTIRITQWVSVTGLIDWKRNFGIYNNTDQFRERQFRTGERWVRQGDLDLEDRVRRFGPFYTEAGAPVSMGVANGAYIEDGSFTRFRELAATFRLPTEFAQRVGASASSLTLGMRNVALWTNYSGPDPDIISDQFGEFTRSDFLSVPNTRRLTARINFQF